MIWFWIWLAGVVIFPISAGIANRYLKIFTTSDFKTEDDVGSFVVGLLLASVFWPLVTVVLTIFGIGLAFRKLFIPE